MAFGEATALSERELAGAQRGDRASAHEYLRRDGDVKGQESRTPVRGLLGRNGRGVNLRRRSGQCGACGTLLSGCRGRREKSLRVGFGGGFGSGTNAKASLNFGGDNGR